MTNKNFAYIKLDRQAGCVVSSGVSWEEFYTGIEHKPANLLLLSGGGSFEAYHQELQLDYLIGGDPEKYVKAVEHAFGNFVWVDFEDLADLDNITNQELAELLYFNHRSEPLYGFHFDRLCNRYAYYSHDDEWSVRVYMENLEDYRPVVMHKLMKEFKGRKRSIAPLPAEIITRLMDMFEQGAAVDFDEITVTDTDTSVWVYPIGDCRGMPYGVDSIHKALDRQRTRHANGGLYLQYNTRGKRWRIID